MSFDRLINSVGIVFAVVMIAFVLATRCVIQSTVTPTPEPSSTALVRSTATVIQVVVLSPTGTPVALPAAVRVATATEYPTPTPTPTMYRIPESHITYVPTSTPEPECPPKGDC